MTTIKDVARLAGVSVATVSRVINGSSKASKAAITSVRSAMDELHYQPNASARALAHKSSETLGLLVADVSDPFFGTMVKAAETIAMENSRFLLTCNGYHDEAKERSMIEHLLRHRCDALVIHAKMLGDDELSGYMERTPGMVVINRLLPGFESRCVALDDEHGGYLATHHLLELGHRQVALICSDHRISDSTDREQGYRRALQQQGLSCDDRYISYAAPDETGGEAAMTELLNRRLPGLTAVVCYNDPMAAGAMAAIYDNGMHIPRDLSLIGFDDVPLARYLHPRLTTVRYPVEQMARQAATIALSLSRGDSCTGSTNIFSPTLVRRHSASHI